MSANYYMNMLELVLDNANEYGIKIQVSAGDYKTNYFTLNPESVEELEQFLQRVKDSELYVKE